MPTAKRRQPERESEPTTPTPVFHSDHSLYETGDPDAPDSIKDSNGDVVLGLCRKCGRGESELVEPCIYVKSVGPSSVVMCLGNNPAGPGAITLRQGESWTPPSKLAVSITNVSRQHDNDYPLWRGPCGEGPLGGVTQSMLSRFLSCRERFRLKYVLGLEPHDRWNHHIGYGNMWHACEEALARGQWHSSHLAHYTKTQLEKYPLQREEIEKWWNVCLVQFPEYVKYWSEHADVKNRTPLLQEEVFDVPYTLPSGRVVRLRGKWDSVDLISDPEQAQGIYLQENKTKGDIDKLQVERQLKFDLQTMMYLVALHWINEHDKDGIGISQPHSRWGHSILGVRYNVVRRPLSGGKGNIKPHAAKYTKTKTTPAETGEEFYERLRRDYLAADPDYWFFRVRVEISERDMQVFRETCLDPLLEQVCWWYDELIGAPVDDLSYMEMYGTCPPMNYRTPFGVWSALEEGGSTEYDHYLETGSDAGLRRVETLFTELQ